MSGPAREGRAVLGIVGGLGAAAGARFYERLVAMTPADRDAAHLEAILYADPAVPDRTEALLGLGPDAGPGLARAVGVLSRAGAEVVCIACITAHHWLPQLRRETTMEFLDAVAETVAVLEAEHPAVERVGLLATTGTVSSGLFQRALAAAGRQCVLPDPRAQERLVMAAVYGPEGLKAGRREAARRRLVWAVRGLREAGAQIVLLACTELPLALGRRAAGLPLLDPMEALARAAIRRCLGVEAVIPAARGRSPLAPRRPLLSGPDPGTGDRTARS